MFNGGFANGHGGGGFNSGWTPGGFNGGKPGGGFNGGHFGPGWNTSDFAGPPPGGLTDVVNNLAYHYHQHSTKGKELHNKAIQDLLHAKHHFQQEAYLRSKANMLASVDRGQCQGHEKAVTFARKEAKGVQAFLNDNVWQ